MTFDEYVKTEEFSRALATYRRKKRGWAVVTIFAMSGIALCAVIALVLEIFGEERVAASRALSILELVFLIAGTLFILLLSVSSVRARYMQYQPEKALLPAANLRFQGVEWNSFFEGDAFSLTLTVAENAQLDAVSCTLKGRGGEFAFSLYEFSDLDADGAVSLIVGAVVPWARDRMERGKTVRSLRIFVTKKGKEGRPSEVRLISDGRFSGLVKRVLRMAQSQN